MCWISCPRSTQNSYNQSSLNELNCKKCVRVFFCLFELSMIERLAQQNVHVIRIHTVTQLLWKCVESVVMMTFDSQDCTTTCNVASILKKGKDTPRQPRTLFAFDCYLLGRFSTYRDQIGHGGSCRAGTTPREVGISKFQTVAMEIGERGHTQAASDI